MALCSLSPSKSCFFGSCMSIFFEMSKIVQFLEKFLVLKIYKNNETTHENSDRT